MYRFATQSTALTGFTGGKEELHKMAKT